MNHGKRDGKGPIVELPVKDVLVVDNHGEGKGDPDNHIAVGNKDFFHHPI